MAKSFSITKHNDLITSAYRLSLTEMQIILYGVSLINPIDGKFPRKYEINIKKFGEMFNRSHSEIYYEVKDAIMNRFWDREFTFHDKYETNRVGALVRAKVKWVTTVKYSDKAGFIKIFFNPEIEDYLHNLKNNFTTYYIKQIAKFKRFYSVRFYEIAAMNINKSKNNKAFFRITLVDLKDILELNNKYPRFCDLKQRVLEPSCSEINRHSDLKISYEAIRTGRQVTDLKFCVYRKEGKVVFENKINEITTQNDNQVNRVSPKTLEHTKNLTSLANTGWDIYQIEEQFYSFMKSKGAPKNIDAAFIGFVKKKIVSPPR